MTPFSVTLRTPMTGDLWELAPLELELRKSLSSPAISMRGRFALPDFPPECLGVVVKRGEEVFFEGKVDWQRSMASAKGITLELEARDKGAALLDNEALPQAYRNLTIHQLFNLLVRPWGFTLLLHSNPTTVPEFTVRKGQSLWGAFSTLSRLACGATPFVEGDVVSVGNPVWGETWVLGSPDYPFLSLEQVIDHYAVLSKVFIRNSDGDYPTEVINPDAISRDIARTRYYIPAGEYSCLPQWDANQRIRRSMKEMEGVALTMPGIFQIGLGETVWINHQLASLPNLAVEEIIHTVGQEGARTRLILKSALYY